MKKYHVTIMSIDPSDNEEDNHQKYGLNVLGVHEEDAMRIGKIEFEKEHPSLPIFWIKAFELVPVILDPNKPIEKIYD